MIIKGNAFLSQKKAKKKGNNKSSSASSYAHEKVSETSCRESTFCSIESLTLLESN
jgi:hypothetical protein